MAKKPPFPVKAFSLTGSTLNEQQRAAVVRTVMSALEDKYKTQKVEKGAKVTRSATASGSGKVSFVLRDTKTKAGGYSFKEFAAGKVADQIKSTTTRK